MSVLRKWAVDLGRSALVRSGRLGGLLTRPAVTWLGLEPERFLAEHARPYPLQEDAFMLNQRDGGCVFLARDAEGRSLCSVHEARPQACRDWDASLLRRECLEGLGAPPPGSSLVLP